MNSITKRWIKGSLAITITLLLVAEVVVVVFMRNSYYTSVSTALINRINTINGTLAASSKLSGTEKTQMLYRMTEEFSEKDKFELMLIDTKGNVLTTSSGFMPSDKMHVEDLKLSQQSADGMASNVYITSMEEKVMSVTFILPNISQDVYAVRMVTSLERVDGELSIIFVFSALAVIAVVVFSVFSGMYFVRSIVKPIQDIEKTAARISKGDFGVRIDNRYNDEIGELCDTINNMAKALGKNDEIKNEFISSVSHELRTPLTAIKGWAETMNNTHDPTTIDKGTSIILGETERLYTMVENLLDFSRIQQAEIILNKEKLDLVAEISDVVIMFSQRIQQSGMKIKFNESEAIIPVLADKNRLKQVFVNLLDNAIKYSEPKGIIEVNIYNVPEQNFAIVEIKDYGKGIPADEIDKVKEKFYKAKGSKKGSGIGLALVNEIIKAHGGEFTISSKVKKYTSMQVKLNTVRTMKGK